MRRRTQKLAPAALALLAATGPAAGQEDGGVTATLGVSSRLEFSDNRTLDPDSPGTSTVSDTRLSFGLADVTPRQELRLNLGGVLRAAALPGRPDQSGFEEPSASLSFERRSGGAELSARARYSRVDLDFLDPLDDLGDILEGIEEGDIDLGDDGLTLDDLLTRRTGTREQFSGGVTLETGRNAPLGLVFGLSTNRENYSGTIDPDLYDNHTDRARLQAILRFSEATTGRVALSLSDYSAEDDEETDRNTARLSAGITRELSEATTLRASLGYAEVHERFGPLGDPDDDETGATAALSVTRKLPRGSIGVSFDSSIENTGRHSTLSLDRAIAFPAAELAFSLGVTDTDEGDLSTVASLDFSRNLPAGAVTARLSRSVETSDDDEDKLITRAQLGYNLSINRVSGVAFNADFAREADAGAGNTDDQSRLGLSASYNRQLTRDWTLSAGYSYDLETEEGKDDAQANTLFVTLDRNFTLLP